MQNSNDAIGNRSRDLPGWSASKNFRKNNVLSLLEKESVFGENNVSSGHIYSQRFCFDYVIHYCGPDSSVGIATGYGLGGPGIECR
jgi:hypothetical protein